MIHTLDPYHFKGYGSVSKQGDPPNKGLPFMLAFATKSWPGLPASIRTHMIHAIDLYL